MSAEGERIGLNARGEKADFERAVGDWSALPHKLVEPLLGDHAASLGIGIRAVAVTGWRTIDRDLEWDRSATRSRSEHQMQIARVKPIDDGTVFRVEVGVLATDRPIA